MSFGRFASQQQELSIFMLILNINLDRQSFGE